MSERGALSGQKVSVPRRLCLNMIVKNEAAILERCLMALADHIACWVIADTGSTDGTRELIRNFFAARGIPGELHEFPFVNFGQARNEALRRARASTLEYDYILFCDADMELKVVEPAFRTALTAIGYALEQRNDRQRYWNTRLLRRDSEALYQGVTHEFISPGKGSVNLYDAWYLDHANGANRPEKIERDTRLLEEDLVRDPQNPRTHFYLGQTHKLAGRYADAARCYAQRVALGGWEEEAWYAQWQEALCWLELDDPGRFELGSLAAFDRRPHRAEPLFHLSQFHRNAGRYEVSLMFAAAGISVPWPREDALFIDNFIYQAGLFEEYALSAQFTADTAKRSRGRFYCDRLALGRDLSARTRKLARRTIRTYCVWAEDLLTGSRKVDVPYSGAETSTAQYAAVADADGLLLLQGFGRKAPAGRARRPDLVVHRLDEAGSIVASRPLAVPDTFPTASADGTWDVGGISLFGWSGVPWCIASHRGSDIHPSAATLARVDLDGGMLCDVRPLSAAGLSEEGVVWHPVMTDGVPGFVAGSDPLRIFRLARRAVEQLVAPCAGDHFNLASPLAAHHDGWLGVVRETVPAGETGGPMMRLAWFSNDFVLKRLSPPFRFGVHPAGTNVGLAALPGQAGRYVVAYTTEAGLTKLFYFTREAADAILSPLAQMLFPLPGT